MPELSSFFISESIQNVLHPTNVGFVPQLTSPITVIRPVCIPSSYSFGVTFGIMGIDPAEKNLAQIKMISPSGQAIADTNQVELPVDQTLDSEMPSEYRGFVMNIDFRNVLFAEAGCYAIEIYINNNLLDSKKVPVYKRNDLSEQTGHL